MTLNQEDYFILMQTIRGIKERVDQIGESLPWEESRGREAFEEVASMIDGLRDIVIELSKEL